LKRHNLPIVEEEIDDGIDSSILDVEELKINEQQTEIDDSFVLEEEAINKEDEKMTNKTDDVGGIQIPLDQSIKEDTEMNVETYAQIEDHSLKNKEHEKEEAKDQEVEKAKEKNGKEEEIAKVHEDPK